MPKREARIEMKLHQQTADCADFDVYLGDEAAPAFRVLLPEHIRGEGLYYSGTFHTVPGEWEVGALKARGKYSVDGWLEIRVDITLQPETIAVELFVVNTQTSVLRDLWADICVSVNHLPGTPGWSNPRFLPGVVDDRTAQGRYWYEKVAPRKLAALTDEGWHWMHPAPENPNAEDVPLYSFLPSENAEATACGVESAEGGYFIFQAWDTPCRWCTPCPGNACMHLRPLLARQLSPGEAASIKGLIGEHIGTRVTLEKGIRIWRENENRRSR